MLRVEIRSTETITKSGTAKASGRPYTIIEQHGLVSLPDGQTRRVVLSLEANEAPLQPGVYEPKAAAFYVGRFDDLAISMRAKHWQPAQAAVRSVAAAK